MSDYVILNWFSITDISLCYNEDGSITRFDTLRQATEYANENCAARWRVIGPI